MGAEPHEPPAVLKDDKHTIARHALFPRQGVQSPGHALVTQPSMG